MLKHLLIFAITALLLSLPVFVIGQMSTRNETPKVENQVIYLRYEEHKSIKETSERDQRPVGEERVRTVNAVVTAYSSSIEETDSSPYITAYNTPTRWGIVANNCLGPGTRVSINSEDFVVEDVGAKRHGCDWFDIWFPSKSEAKEWGIQKLPVVIYE